MLFLRSILCHCLAQLPLAYNYLPLYGFRILNAIDIHAAAHESMLGNVTQQVEL